MPETRPLAGRHAVITGGGRGIGAAIAHELGRLGAPLTLMGRRQDVLDRQAEAVAQAHDVEVAAIECDVTDPAAVTEAFRVARETLGPAHILVCNAGQSAGVDFMDTTPDLWDRMLAVNLSGAWHCIHEALPAMLAARSGRVVCIASTAALKGYRGTAAYAASKAGLLGLVRALAIETARAGVTVNAVCPGYTDTDMAAAARDGLATKLGRTPEQTREMIEKTIPRRTLIEPAEVANAVGWLVSPGASAVTGQTIVVAGGEVM